jgi:hypothetical protein
MVSLVAITPAKAVAGDLTVRFGGVVKPDAELRDFVADIRRLYMSEQKFDPRKADALFAPRVKTFWRSLDPFQPWKRNGDIRTDYLRGAADIMVEQGEPEEGKPLPDYRPDALKAIAEQVTDGQPFGTLKEMPGAICAPAEYRVDRKAALTFAKKFELDAYSLRFFAQDSMLYAKPNLKSDFIGTVPPYTLMMFDHDPKAKDPWALYETSGGKRGYLMDDKPVLGLAQHHVCFAKVRGRYRIVALFGYGL